MPGLMERTLGLAQRILAVTKSTLQFEKFASRGAIALGVARSTIGAMKSTLSGPR